MDEMDESGGEEQGLVLVWVIIVMEEYIINDCVEYNGGDDVSLGDPTFGREGCSVEPALSWDNGMCIPDIVEYA